MFFYLYKVFFSGFLQFNGNFVDAQNNLKYRDWTPVTALFSQRRYRKEVKSRTPLRYNNFPGNQNLKNKFRQKQNNPSG